MEEIDLLEQIKRKLEALQARIEARTDPRLIAEVADAIRLAAVHLPSVFMQARRVLEIVVRDIHRRELTDPGSKPLADMIKSLYEQKRSVIGPRVATDLHYIRANGNLIIHPQDDSVDINPRDAEPVLFMLLNVVEWYLTQYLPERQGEAAPRTSAGQQTLPPPPNPYRGLLAFREEHSANYFGREPDAADLLAAIQRQALVAVVGPSGSGKSSLVYAGVVPRLRTTDGIRIADFRPRGRPFAELAQALVALWQIDATDRLAQARKLAAHLADAQVTLTDAVQETLRQTGGSRLVLIADQFEELYTLGQSDDETQGFTDLLVQAVQDSLAIPNRAGPPDLCLLLTLRADFLGHALAHPGLTALMDRCPPKLLGPVEDRARLRAIIEQPARGVGVTLEGLLPERILRDLAQLPGTAEQVGGASLPLLEFALAQLWGQQQERRLTHRGYEGLGGLQQALSRHADGVLARLDPADQARMRHVLVQMVRPGEGTEDTRQVATRDQLRPDDWPLVVRLADADTRLVVTGHDQTTDQDTAELVHETLIRHWQPLRDWLNADRAFRLWQNGLRQAMGEWERADLDDGALLAGARLAEAEERIATDAGRVSDAEVRFIQASAGRRDADAAERERQRRERERLQRRISLGLAGFLAVALGLGSFAGWQWWLAEQRRAEVAANKAELAASLQQETQAKAAAVQQQQRAQEQALSASLNLARAHEEKALGLLRQSAATLAMRDYQKALLHALQAQRQPIAGQMGLRREAFAVLDSVPLEQAFAQRWISHEQVVGTLVRPVAFSPDGRLLASAAGVDGAVRLCDAKTGESIRLLTAHNARVTAIAFSPDGRLLASASRDNSARLWDPATGEYVRTLIGHDGAVSAIAFSPDGRLLASASEDNSLRLWGPATGQHVRTLIGHDSGVTAVVFSPDGRVVASASMDGSLRLWDAATGQTLRVLTGHKAAVFAVAFSPDGQQLASAGGKNVNVANPDYTVRLWDSATGKPLRTLNGHRSDVNALAFSPDGHLLASASLDDTLRLWEPTTGNVVLTLSGVGSLDAVTFSADGRLMAGGSDNYVQVWDMAAAGPRRLLTGQDISAFAFSPNGHLLAAVSEHKELRLWDILTDESVRTLPVDGSAITAVAFSPDGSLLASASAGSTVRLWNPATGEQFRMLHGDAGTFNGVTFSPAGNLLADWSDGAVRLWNPKTGELVRMLTDFEGHIRDVAFSPNGQLLASSSGAVRLTDVATGETVREIDWGMMDAGPYSVTFSPDGQLLATAHIDAVGTSGQFPIGLYDPNTGDLIRSLDGHRDSVNAIAFSRDSRLVASASGEQLADHSVRLWNSTIGSMVRLLVESESAHVSVAFSPDGRLLASLSAGNVYFWDTAIFNVLQQDDLAPAPRAALISEALQRLWRLKIDGLEIVEHSWCMDAPRRDGDIEQDLAIDPLSADTPPQCNDIEQEFTIDIRLAESTADPSSQPILRTFDIRPLLAPPPPDKNKLDQLLDWLAEQEPRLKP